MTDNRSATVAAAAKQRVLDPQRITEFYHDNFVTDQVRDFAELVVDHEGSSGLVADVGGGCGYFVEAIGHRFQIDGRVLDSDDGSLAACEKRGIAAVKFDALQPQFRGDEQMVSFNLILHHLVGRTEKATRSLQRRALSAWSGQCDRIFVNEYIYDSFVVRDLSAYLIYQITGSPLFSAVGRMISRLVPSLHANTFGVGVRFRSAEDWRILFREAGYKVIGYRRGEAEPISLPRRLLTISSIRRDSFLLVKSID